MVHTHANRDTKKEYTHNNLYAERCKFWYAALRQWKWRHPFIFVVVWYFHHAPTNMQLLTLGRLCSQFHSTSLVSIVITCDKLLLLTPNNSNSNTKKFSSFFVNQSSFACSMLATLFLRFFPLFSTAECLWQALDIVKLWMQHQSLINDRIFEAVNKYFMCKYAVRRAPLFLTLFESTLVLFETLIHLNRHIPIRAMHISILIPLSRPTLTDSSSVIKFGSLIISIDKIIW